MLTDTIQKPTTTARCENCGDAFRPKRATARYCSPRCRVAANRSRETREQAPVSVTEGDRVSPEPVSVTSAPDPLPAAGNRHPERQFYLVHFMDEAPRIGSGRRHVELVEIGVAHVLLRYIAAGVEVDQVLPRSWWEASWRSRRPPVPAGEPVALAEN